MLVRASGRAGLMAAALAALSGCGDGTRPADAAPTMDMLDPEKTHYGLTYSQWAVAYMKWQFETAASILWDIKDCTAGQDVTSPVVFLEQELATHTEPSPCAFGSEKAILFPLLSRSSPVIHYADSSMPVPSSDVGVLTLRINDSISEFRIDEASVRVDDSELYQPREGKIEPISYEYTPYPGDSLLYRYYGVSPVPEVVSPAVVGGYWVLLGPLTRGPHEISILLRGSLSGTIVRNQFTYRLMLE
jgi:hypothetical protein